MIGVTEALQHIETTTTRRKTKLVKLDKSLNMVLSKDVIPPINMPPFRQSAMDGYAIHLCNTKSYTIIDEIKAGDSHSPELKCGEAVRIFTGAAVPKTASAVVMQEHVIVNNKTLELQKLVVQKDNIRPKGEQIKQGAIALEKGTKITPAAIGYLASLGITEIDVYQQPKITIIVTGNELTPLGQSLQHGEIYESNSIMLASALRDIGYNEATIQQVNDNYTITKTTLDTAIQTNDIVLITGGISVGDYDFVGDALNELKVEEIFYKVRQKPGKPLFFGKKNSTIIFALPGNPAATLSCFYVYVYPTLQQMSGLPITALLRTSAKSLSEFEKKGNRAQFLKAIVTDKQVTILEGQSSAMLHTFALANALVYLPEEQNCIAIGDEIQIICLPK